MAQERIIRRSEVTPDGGSAFIVEVTEAYTNGQSRFERVVLGRSEVIGKTLPQLRQAIYDAMNNDVGGLLRGQAIEEPAVSKEILEDRMETRYAVWQRWKETRAEAQARSLGAAVVNALTNRENAAWAAYVEMIQAWRAAP